MFGKRRSRNSVAYTGVGYLASTHHPDNGAMAAALTIGKKLPPAQNNAIHQKPPAIGSLGSLLKRSPSLQSNSIRSTSTPNHYRRGSTSSDRHSFTPRVEYSVDDSFTDSQIEEMGRDADAHYSNRAQLRDLKLSHLPPQQQVKMVKKYVPTPNGIQVVEVPETSMKQAIARSNSMRSGLSLNRAGLLSSRNNLLSRIPKSPSRSGSLTAQNTGQKRVTWKRSTLAASKIDESAELEPSEQSKAAAELQRQIDEERQLAAKLESQRKEYEQLKQLRLQNEKHRAELERLREEEESYSRLPSRQTSPHPVESVPTSISTTLDAPHPVKPQAPTLNDLPDDTPQPQANDDAPQAQSTDDEEVPIEPVPFAVDEFEQKKAGKNPEKLPTSIGDQEEDVTSTYSLDDASVTHAVTVTAAEIDTDDVIQNYAALGAAGGSEEDEFGIVEVPNETESPTLAQQVKSRLNGNGKDSIALPNDVDSISESTTPKFDPTPEIIQDEPQVDTLAHPPNAAGLASSIKSGSSSDSRPIKSAMKNSRSTYALNNNSNSNANVSPAQQAYLSLTTAENTRLNSKLSSGQLNENDSLSPQHHAHPGPPRSPVHAQKLSATTLRKTQHPPQHQQHHQQQQQQQGGLSDRSLRPRTTSDASYNRQSTGGGMSSRTFKSSQPQGLPPHPYNGPNYHSPAKAKAAELFAKANNRPASTAHPLKRESSFNKGSEEGKAENNTAHQPPQRNGKHRFTLRHDAGQQGAQQGGLTAAAATTAHANIQQQAQQQAQQIVQLEQQQKQQQQPPQQQQPAARSHEQRGGGFKGFRSRIADSDEEDNVKPAQGGGFRSRFRDLEEQAPVQEGPITTLREPKVDPALEEKKPKKKKKFLKKLFGKN